MVFVKKEQEPIVFKPSIKQFDALQFLQDKVTTEIGYGGGAGSGKSYLGCFWIFSNCLAYPGTAYAIGRRELVNLKRTTLLTFFKVCSEYNIKADKHYTYNQQNGVIQFSNGSTVFLLDLSHQPSDPLFTRFGGLELTAAFVDESNECEIEAINILNTRLGRKDNEKYGLLPKLLETFNPSKEHIYHRYYKPWKTKTLPANRQFIRALPTDNPHIGQSYLNQLANSDKMTRERLLYGNFEYDDDPNSLIDFDAINDMWTNPSTDEYDTNERKYIVADVARKGNDRSVITLWRGLTLISVITLKKQTTDVTSQAIRDLAFRSSVPYSRILVDEDGVGGGVMDQLKGIKGFTANSSPIKLNDEKQNYQNLKAQCAYTIADLINRRAISILPDLLLSGDSHTTFKELLIADLEQIKSKDLDKDGKLKIMPKDEVKERIGRSPDFGDCFIMRAFFELSPSQNEAPRATYAPTRTYGQSPYRGKRF